jgi:23S rRNA (pseudouridine1915-N3)-methyltransferase
VRLLIIAVGKAKAGPSRALFEEYRGRLTWPLELIEVEEKRALPPEQRQAREAALLLAALPRKSTGRTIVVALDEHGKDLSSADLATRLGAWRDQGTSEIAFLIGGADGHGDAVKTRADFLLSLGRLTWPHLMVRAMLAEQLYRAQTILSGHPYHRE